MNVIDTLKLVDELMELGKRCKPDPTPIDPKGDTVYLTERIAEGARKNGYMVALNDVLDVVKRMAVPK